MRADRFWLILEEEWGRSHEQESARGGFWGPDWWFQECLLYTDGLLFVCCSSQ